MSACWRFYAKVRFHRLVRAQHHRSSSHLSSPVYVNAILAVSVPHPPTLFISNDINRLNVRPTEKVSRAATDAVTNIIPMSPRTSKNRVFWRRKDDAEVRRVSASALRTDLLNMDKNEGVRVHIHTETITQAVSPSGFLFRVVFDSEYETS